MYPLRTHWTHCVRPADVAVAAKELTYIGKTYGALAIDVETTGLEVRDNKLVLLTIAGPDHAFIIPASLLDSQAIAVLLDSSGIVKLAHNCAFDWAYLRYHAGLPVRSMYDTKRAMIADPRCLDRRDSSLKGTAKVLLNIALDKGPATTFAVDAPLSEVQLNYCAVDALILWPVFLAQQLKGYTRGVPTPEDLQPMFDYLHNDGPWPKYGEYPSLELGEEVV